MPNFLKKGFSWYPVTHSPQTYWNKAANCPWLRRPSLVPFQVCTLQSEWPRIATSSFLVRLFVQQTLWVMWVLSHFPLHCLKLFFTLSSNRQVPLSTSLLAIEHLPGTTHFRLFHFPHNNPTAGSVTLQERKSRLTERPIILPVLWLVTGGTQMWTQEACPLSQPPTHLPPFSLGLGVLPWVQSYPLDFQRTTMFYWGYPFLPFFHQYLNQKA